MGFRDLKGQYQEAGVFDPGKVISNEEYKRLYLLGVFEIAGNLDTIALCQRAIVEQTHRIAIIAECTAKEETPPVTALTNGKKQKRGK